MTKEKMIWELINSEATYFTDKDYSRLMRRSKAEIKTYWEGLTEAENDYHQDMEEGYYD